MIMTKLEQLFIRACKSSDGKKRIRSLYRRFYYYEYDPQHAVNILAEICDKHLHLKTAELISDLSPNNEWKHPANNYWERCLSILIGKIRLSEVSKFDGLTAPLRFRLVA
jgi:hypothetical protein